MTSTSVPVTDARAQLPSLLDRVEAGDEVTLTRHGKPVAVLVHPDLLRARRIEPEVAELQSRVSDLIDVGRSRPVRAAPSLTAHDADAWVREQRADRSAR